MVGLVDRGSKQGDGAGWGGFSGGCYSLVMVIARLRYHHVGGLARRRAHEQSKLLWAKARSYLGKVVCSTYLTLATLLELP